ncbi:MAG TPA: TetR/AcrR family transcriptional regulator [Candidatus Angelobacter sp.]|nr:TetR/AcrR family transcriptional regulator [Candidatus Angelobacter sp.]
MPDTAAPRTARERARLELTREIVETARAHLETEGAASLSLRAVARDLGMVSSAIYRYFPSRDDLLTRLIIDAYDALGDAVDAREAAVARDDLLGRWLAVAHACRDWALAHPQEWALVYGSPVPGYVAPEDTIGPATRVSVTLVTILVDARARGAEPEAVAVPRRVSRGMRQLREFTASAVPDSSLVAGVMARTQLFGHIGLEVDGQFANTIDDLDAFFDHIMRRTAATLGLA